MGGAGPSYGEIREGRGGQVGVRGGLGFRGERVGIMGGHQGWASGVSVWSLCMGVSYCSTVQWAVASSFLLVVSLKLLPFDSFRSEAPTLCLLSSVQPYVELRRCGITVCTIRTSSN